MYFRSFYLPLSQRGIGKGKKKGSKRRGGGEALTTLLSSKGERGEWHLRRGKRRVKRKLLSYIYATFSLLFSLIIFLTEKGEGKNPKKKKKKRRMS